MEGEVLELGVADVEAALEPEPDDEPEALEPLELCAKVGIATRARLLEQRREISCRERFMILRGLRVTNLSVQHIRLGDVCHRAVPGSFEGYLPVPEPIIARVRNVARSPTTHSAVWQNRRPDAKWNQAAAEPRFFGRKKSQKCAPKMFLCLFLD